MTGSLLAITPAMMVWTCKGFRVVMLGVGCDDGLHLGHTGRVGGVVHEQDVTQIQRGNADATHTHTHTHTHVHIHTT